MKSKLLLGLLMFSTLSFSQKSDCSSLEKEVQNNKIQIAELSKQVNYYQETLDLLKPIKTANVDGLEFSVTKVVGSKKDKTVTVTFIYKNTEQTERRSLRCMNAYFIDPQGEQYQTWIVSVAADNGSVAYNVKPDIPTKATTKFKINETDFPMIRVLSVKVDLKDQSQGGMTRTKEAVFENLPVVWE